MQKQKRGKVYFIGAGPGDPELLTVKAARIIEKADVCIYAGSLVNPKLCTSKRENGVSYDSASMDLNEIVTLIAREVKKGNTVARIHSGDPSLYGAIYEQIVLLEKRNISYEIIPGVSSVFASAAALKRELTVPEISQTLILTRISGRTKVPSRESIARLAQSRATMAIFLSIGQIARVVDQLLTSYPDDTPVAVVYKASWPDQKIIKGTLATISRKVRRAGVKRQALILVGRALDVQGEGLQSKLYDEGFTHGFRKAQAQKKTGIALIALTAHGAKLGTLLKDALPDAHLYLPGKLGMKGVKVRCFSGGLEELLSGLVDRYSRFICIMASGIAVRTFGPFLFHKSLDPAVVVVDEKGEYAISLISGHLGGANDLARETARITGGAPVITTASDVHGVFALDLLAKQLECKIADFDLLTRCNYALLHGETVGVFPEILKPHITREKKGNIKFYKSIKNLYKSACRFKIIISSKLVEKCVSTGAVRGDVIVLNPRTLVVGIGCNRNTRSSEIESAVRGFLERWGLSFDSVKKIATVDLKADEKGLISFARRHNLEIEFFTPQQLNSVVCPSPPSQDSLSAVGSRGVCEPSSLLGAKVSRLLHPKEKTGNVTVAVAEIPLERFFRGKNV